MIQHLHSIICVRSILDKNTGLASYIDVIEGITLTESEKITLPPFTLVSKFWIKNGIEDNKILDIEVLRRKTGKTRSILLQEMSFPIEKKGENILINLEVQNLTLESAGLWEFEIRWRIKDVGNWKKGSIIPLNVIIQKNLPGKHMGTKMAETKEK